MNAPSPSSTGSKLIARIWHGVTDAARADEYAAYLERTGARECRATPGNRGVYVLRRIKRLTWFALVACVGLIAADLTTEAISFQWSEQLALAIILVDHYEVIGGD